MAVTRDLNLYNISLCYIAVCKCVVYFPIVTAAVSVVCQLMKVCPVALCESDFQIVFEDLTQFQRFPLACFPPPNWSLLGWQAAAIRSYSYIQ